ncbi:hypothetical protein [Variovorax terrae]|uniref:Uncharacterized protein n=1 Tax=Variovorax terrae TaxID=2923278 RepID=A0A9X2ANL4_9BURK|nr:hypothetical protein [Variovorax terrae]MCJ0764509.1 hypothetical protein [Variovorax terrae]
MDDWSFADPPNVAVFIDRSIVEGGNWIAYVYHDADDGAWQFRATSSSDEGAPMLVSLRSVTKMDSSVAELADLPLGWRAWRDTPQSMWERAEK